MAGDAGIAEPSASGSAAPVGGSLEAGINSLDAIVDMAVGLAQVGGAGPVDATSGGGGSNSSAIGAPERPLDPPAAEAAPPPEPAPSLGQEILGGPHGWTMTDRGYVFDGDQRYRGRITSWGSKSKRVSVKCASHGCSKTKARSMVTNGQLAHWLAQDFGQPSEEVPVTALRRRHEAAFVF